MKKGIVAGLLSIISFAASAETAYWTGEGEYSGREKCGTWDASNFSTGELPTAETDLVLGTISGQNTGIVLKEGEVGVVKSFTYALEGTSSEFRFYRNTALIISQDLVSERRGTFVFMGDDGAGDLARISVGGNVIVGRSDNTNKSTANLRFGLTRSESNSGWRPLGQVEIAKDLTLYNAASVQFNVGTTKTESEANISNPDVYIGGIINLVPGSGEMTNTNPTFYLTYRYGSSSTPTITPTASVISANGLSGNGTVYGGTILDYYSEGCVGILHLRNDNAQTFSGWLRDGYGSKLKIVMDGTESGLQKMAGNSLIFSGGLEIRGGTFEIRRYDYTSTTVSGKSSDSHGKLTMLGGRFKFTPGDGIVSDAFGFDTFEYADGIIYLYVNQDGSDIIKLHDGTITPLDDFTGKVVFELDGNLDLLLDNYVKIVEWTQKTALGNDNFYADDYGMSKAVFDVRDDGLYVKYSAIPEPAACAAVLGIFCIALAFFRHRNKIF